MQIARKWVHQERPRFWASVGFWSEDHGETLSDEFAWFEREDEAEAWVRGRITELASAEPPTTDGYWLGSVHLVTWERVGDSGAPDLDWDWESDCQVFSLDQDQKPPLLF